MSIKQWIRKNKELIYFVIILFVFIEIYLQTYAKKTFIEFLPPILEGLNWLFTGIFAISLFTPAQQSSNPIASIPVFVWIIGGFLLIAIVKKL